MIRLRHKLLIHVMRLSDQAIILLCLALFGNALSRTYELSQVAAILIDLMGSMVLFNHFVRYDVNRFTEFAAQVTSLLLATASTVLLVYGVGLVFGFPSLTPTQVLIVWASSTTLIITSRLVVHEALKYSRRSGMTSRQLLIVGVNSRAQELAQKLERCPELGYRILGFVSEQPAVPSVPLSAERPDWHVRGALTNLQGILQGVSVDEMLICLPLTTHLPEIGQTVKLGEQLGIVVRVISDPEHDTLLRRMRVENFDGQCVLTLFRESLLFQLMGKRILDVGGALLLLTVLSPLLAVVALLIKLTSPGPVFYVQERMGMNRRRFNLYKFRSMSVDADRRRSELAHLNEMDGPVFKIKNDPRVTPVGRFIRKTSIDELPQLFNVLSGSMSLVGPRPPLPSEVEQYDWLFQRRLSIKPGITCLWQVSGRNQIAFREWMELDRQYVTNWSLWLDLKILFRTIPVVLGGRGAS